MSSRTLYKSLRHTSASALLFSVTMVLADIVFTDIAFMDVASANPSRYRTDDSRWLSPIDGFNVTKVFGEIDHQSGEKNRGVDVVAVNSHVVIAPADGLVTVSAQSDTFHPGRHNIVVIDHGNGEQTLFADLGSRKVAVNQWIRKGQHIGTVRETSCSGYGAATHIEVIVNGKAIDPFKKLPYVFFDLVLQP